MAVPFGCVFRYNVLRLQSVLYIHIIVNMIIVLLMQYAFRQVHAIISRYNFISASCSGKLVHFKLEDANLQ
jgi:hypothetical protein